MCSSDLEMLAKRLKKQGVPHNVLNAKQHEREAEIVAQAGRKGAVTIPTNMAARRPETVVGGHPDLPPFPSGRSSVRR